MSLSFIYLSDIQKNLCVFLFNYDLIWLFLQPWEILMKVTWRPETVVTGEGSRESECAALFGFKAKVLVRCLVLTCLKALITFSDLLYALNLVLKKNQQKRIIDIIWGLKSEIKRFWISAGNAPSLCNLIHIPLSLHTTALLSSLYCMLTRFTRISQVRINSKFAMFTYDVVETLLTVLPCASTSQDPSG